jgi:tetratricopeptide (TPR) repeat protein
LILSAFFLLLAITSTAVAGAEARFCGPRSEVRAELEKAAAVSISDWSAFDRNIAVWQALRQRYPNDLFVHESYQDAVQRFGVEGHLRVLTDEYQTLSSEHPGQLMYRYLFARSLIGRGTYPAIQEMSEILAGNPEFAPAHRMLAGIYSTEVFRDVPKANAERERFLQLCPGTQVSEYPGRLPDSSPLIDRAGKLLGASGDPDRVAELAEQGLKDDEWRLQHVRPFDWYSAEFKIQNQRRLQAEYWSVWGIQVRCYRKAGNAEKAAELLVAMDHRAVQLRGQPGNAYWDALVLLARLYADGNQRDRAEEKIATLRKMNSEHPDSVRAAQIGDLQGVLGAQAAVKTRP